MSDTIAALQKEVDLVLPVSMSFQNVALSL